MAAQLLNRAFTNGAAAPAGLRRRAVRVQAAAAPPNVVEARNWIASWKNKMASNLNRASWLPGTTLPDHLDGSLPADFGFDPIGLARDPAALKWYVQAEIVHSRFAMLGVAGILFPELAANIGISWPGAGVAWYDAGKFEYFAPASSLFMVQMFLFAFVEMRRYGPQQLAKRTGLFECRYQDIVKPGSANQDPFFSNNKLPANEPGYPGGIFDPFGWSKGDMATLKVKELKNGRLAMLAMLGFWGQYNTTHTTPLKNLATHLADPWTTTVFSNDLARLH